MAIASTASVLLQVVLHLTMVATLGTNRATDSLFLAGVLPQLALSIFLGPLGNLIVPWLVEHRPSEGALTAALALRLFVGGLCLFALTRPLAPLLALVLAPAFDAAERDLLASLLPILVLELALTGPNVALRALQHVHRRFLLAEGATIAGAAVGIGAFIATFGTWGLAAAPLALLARSCTELSVLALSGRAELRSPACGTALAPLWRRAAPLMGLAAVTKTEALVDRVIAGLAAPGALSLFHLGQTLYRPMTAILGRALVQPAAPILAERSLAQDAAGFYELVHRRARVAGLLGALALVCIGGGSILISLSDFGFGRLGSSDLQRLLQISLCLGGVLIGGVVGGVLVQAYYARNATRAVARIGLIGFLLGLVMKLAGFFAGGVIGLALASSTYYILNAAWLMLNLRSAAAFEGAGGARSCE
ncbi:MAG: hypothetical protein M9894_07680 [Planctomycetes bacterium]|nr:hypothetical protein [Planctomycetota bacterium]